MEDLKLVEKVVITPENPTDRRRIFLSNIDLSLVVYQESVSFFDPPLSKLSFSESCNNLCSALGKLLVPYDFFAGRLVPALEDKDRFEIDCNGAGAVVAAAKTSSTLSQLGELLAPKEEFRQLVAFLQDESEQVELQDKPLLHLQLTQFACGSLAVGIRYNHAIMDGTAFSEFKTNWAAFSRGDGLVIEPKPDRTIFRGRDPPIINHLHQEYSTSCNNNFLTAWDTEGIDHKDTPSQGQTHIIYLSRQYLASLKKAALEDGRMKNCTTFQVVAAKMWKAWSIAVKMKDDITSTLLFPTNIRNIIRPKAPNGFAGNAVLTCFAQARINELKEKDDSYLVTKVQEGIYRVDDDYVRSVIDWLTVHCGGLPCMENSLRLVPWWRLRLEEDVFACGKLKCTTPIVVKPGFAFLLPDLQGEGGINVCLELPDAEMEEFSRLMMEW
ncbi:Anthranilate N-benzoyltransferase protein, putative [Ricinus communis]|uniref:Anthranilate N-benzoyltransferase protein, putative n=1 Tax=Ricinus communis TaxID=3988 RepID=B9S503_RICCO|nr:Anthranilate N-benzoyltransferase protein, putative [Ricinus communis]